ncbi:MAG: hypothetical protein CVU50_03250 [Candidatus Cloacimonetes bacterium HGW-Cloacimonetes-3]|nr:MAG: hypothetical protein CVU50_03250 [Candidatus Cloacimonetes bacterium HGW-Cloacimonetes-3]
MNIYIRSQETDLFKYLSDESTAFLMKEAVSQTVSARECVFHHGTRPEYIVILVSGELEIVSPAGRIIGYVHPGEISGEACFTDGTASLYTLRAYYDSLILKISFATLEKFMSATPENGARIQAALNDSLCLKIIHVTHIREEHA